MELHEPFLCTMLLFRKAGLSHGNWPFIRNLRRGKSPNEGVPESAMKSRFYEAINEPKTIKRRPVLGTLAYLADAANSAIKLFS